MFPARAELSPCPDSPNCVSSLASDPRHFIEPIRYTGPADAAMQRLVGIVLAMPRTTRIREEGGYLHTEVRSFLFRFVDDLELSLDVDNGVIHVRSASRSGYSDLGVNRRRVERLRRRFHDAQ